MIALLQFNQFTIGRAWTSDYGDPQDPEDFDFIYPISPLHNIPTGRALPATMLVTADRESTFPFFFHGLKLMGCYPFADDDRVVPLHSFKYAAALQHLHPKNPHPLLISLETKAGHGSGRSTDQMYVSPIPTWTRR